MKWAKNRLLLRLFSVMDDVYLFQPHFSLKDKSCLFPLSAWDCAGTVIYHWPYPFIFIAFCSLNLTQCRPFFNGYFGSYYRVVTKRLGNFLFMYLIWLCIPNLVSLKSANLIWIYLESDIYVCIFLYHTYSIFVIQFSMMCPCTKLSEGQIDFQCQIWLSASSGILMRCIGFCDCAYVINVVSVYNCMSFSYVSCDSHKWIWL